MTEKPIPTLPTSNVLYLLDGGDLLSKLQWKKGQMVQQICWHNFENENYGENAEVAFDGYPDEPTTKDTTHLKYTKGKNRRLVKFALNSIMSMFKEKFIFNKINEQEFLQHLTEYMNYHSIKVCVPYFLDTYDISSLKTLMKLKVQPMFTCVSITREPKLYVTMFHTSLHLLLQAKQGQ